MDITRHWRLKSARSRLLATKSPETGAVMLPQTTISSLQPRYEMYNFGHGNSEGGNGHRPEEIISMTEPKIEVTPSAGGIERR